jgi:aspartate-semialdehyde dehydrogenase
VFFTTSNTGGKAPNFGKEAPALKDAKSIDELKAMDIIITCQGGDYTSEVYPSCALPAGTATGSTRPRRCAWTRRRSSSSIRST